MGRKMTLWRGVADTWGQVGSDSGEAERRVGASSVLGWLAGPVARSRELGRLRAEQAEPAAGFSSPFSPFLFFFSFFHFCFMLHTCVYKSK